MDLQAVIDMILASLAEDIALAREHFARQR